ncbi:probable LRR receptor-like serine/threonine-protein kinase At3g47570 [Herrania umbratica]|uniref:non-specific serine/threonine protein kinase n=1 Tax=Herrania umbratica TaxID=108875 RepID=A0A6J1BGB2_9ROSI|nr:probable LRR receptor-like serine/threonine-protein kinase At3g47570 [Herrania umbratica]
MNMRKLHFLSSALFIHCCFMVSYAMIAVRNLTTDQHALLEFKHHIIDPQNILANNWSNTHSVCNWVGVSCSAKHSRVIALSLPNMDLTGTVPPHLGNLSFLVSLNLDDNHFHGHLPSTVYNISSLQMISLASNGLSGSLPQDICRHLPKLEALYLHLNEFAGQIPSSIDECSNLQNLTLYLNRFSGIIPRSIGNLTRLKLVDMSGNNLAGEIPWEIGNLLSLEEFAVGDMSLIVGPIPASIFNISSLKLIYLYNNSLSGSIPQNMCYHLVNLETFVISYNEISGHIPSKIGDCRNLQYLSLSYNRFSGFIPRSIGNSTKLKKIYVGVNDLEGEIPREIENLIALELFSAVDMRLNGVIPPSIFNISSLEVIDVSNNSLSGKLPDMSSVSNLERLIVWGNNLKGNIPDSICNASKLTLLDLNRNSFHGLIPNTLGNLRFLEVLRLWSNNLTTQTSNGEWSFLSSLANCRHLRVLELSYNPLNALLPNSISNLSTSLQYLRVNDCKIGGKIPTEIGSLSNIIALGLALNELSGSIPMTIGRLRNLQVLHLDGNRLQGSLPHDLCGLKRLNRLSLGANELDGPLPTCLGDLTSLRYLNLSSNKLHATIPSSLWSLRDLLSVDLSSNSLIGPLPLDIENLKVLIYLDLSKNLLSSDIPDTIGSLDDIQLLALSSNSLQGPIPKSLGNLISLEVLDLSDNNLSGVIPKSLEQLLDLKHFDVSFNRLEGQIPSGGPFANFIAESFMKNYALCGSPRLQVPPCKNTIHRQSKKALVHVLKYVLPTIASVITIAACIIVYKKWQKRSTSSEIGEDLIPLETWRRVSYNQLSQATNGFSENNLLGSGSFGSVYKGILSDGTNVAVKVFKLQIDGAFRSFDNECEVMRNILHRNLVKVITSCSNIDFKALVLEYMPNGSLEKWLYSHNYFLDIFQRINIMIDVASALEYLHLGHPMPVIHCDLKPGNVLLDQDMVAHVGDFGIAKLLGEEESMKQTITLATIGYMAPEYGSTGILSVKSDVYSYGILLMEVFTRKKPTDEIFAGEMSMKRWVERSFSDGIIGVADSSLMHTKDEFFVVKANCISSIMRLALDCSAELPEDRKDMKDVVSMLKNIKIMLLNNIKEDQ